MTAVITEQPTTPTRAQWRRLTWTEAIGLYLPARLRHRRVAEAVPLIGICLLAVLMAVPHLRTAFIDEALYINAGYDYLAQWAGGPTAPDHGAAFSGAPFLYPVLAASADWVGGLYLVRALSLAFIVLALWGLARFTETITGSAPAGRLAAFTLAVTGPVLFVAWIATFDALVICLLAWGCALAARPGRRWVATATCAGLLAGVAVAVKYTAVLFVPVIVGLALLSSPGVRRALARTAITAGACLGLLALMWRWWAEDLRGGLMFTTLGREALSPTTAGDLIVTWALVLLLPMVLAVAGTLLLARTGRRGLLVGAGLLLAALALPVGQIRMGEDTSFQKHLAYTALFLAPLVGLTLARWARGSWRYGPVVIVLVMLMVVGVARTGALFVSWADTTHVLNWLERDSRPGLYLSSAADTLKYHTRDEAGMEWDTTFSLYAQGPDAIAAAGAGGRYEAVILLVGPSGSPVQDAGQERLVQALAANPGYQRTTLTDGEGVTWWIYAQVDR